MDSTPHTTTPAPRNRRWALPLAFVGGATAVVLLGGAALAGTNAAVAEPLMMRDEMRGEMRMQHGADGDMAMRGEHIAGLAQQLGVDADELTATLEAFHAERAVDGEALRDMLAGLEPEERRDAMRAFADERRAAVAELLGVDAEVLAELHEATGHGPRGPQMGRMGPHARG